MITALYTALLPGRPKLASKMTGRKNSKYKYMDVPGNYTFSEEELRDHLNGKETYAVTLGLVGMARAGCRDYDEGDESLARAALAAATAMGLHAFLILINGRSHLWVLFDRDVPVTDIRCLLRKLPRGKGEIYPNNSRIRLPFGVHKLHKTRGTLILSDGQCFDLDKELRAAVAAVLALPRNTPPPEAPEAERRNEAAWGDAYKPENWQTLPNGKALLKSPRLAKLAELSLRAQLKTILEGGRVTVNGDGSDSTQVASFVFHLMRSQYPEAEVRAMALELKEQLRPGRSLDHFRAHVDAEIERYRPRTYNPQPTMIVGINVVSSSNTPRQEASRARKDRPQKVAGAAGYLAWIRKEADSETGALMLSVRECAERLGISESTIIRYERELKAANLIERRAYARRQAGCLFVQPADQRGVIMPESVPQNTPHDVVSSDPVLPHVDAETSNVACKGKEHSPPDTTQPTSGASVLSSPRPLAETVYAAIRACEAEERVNTQTGEIRPGRVSRKKVAAMVRETRKVQDAVLRYVYDKQMRRRQAERQVEKLPHTPEKRLKALIRMIDRILAAGETDPRYWWAWYLYDHVSAELERKANLRRGLSADHRKRQIEKRDQDELWDALEHAGLRPIVPRPSPPMAMAA